MSISRLSNSAPPAAHPRLPKGASRKSFLKTAVLVVAGTITLGFLLLLACLLFSGWIRIVAVVVLGTGTLAALVTSLACQIVLWRDSAAKPGVLDPFLSFNQSRSEAGLNAPAGFRAGFLRRLAARALVGHTMLPGDEVEILTYEEILQTLDEGGLCDGMPFQIEMIRFCGQRSRVFRSLDKIYDYGRTKGMRRLRDSVLLSGLRCDGSSHGGCQALCHLVWNVRWLKRPGAATSPPRPREAARMRNETWLEAKGTTGPDTYICQYTALHAATTAISDLDLCKSLRPWVAGNLTFPALVVAQSTKLFNTLQRLRGGSGYPNQPVAGEGPSPEARHLEVGQRVRVRSPEEIGSTLDKRSMNRGLWFDRDMLKHSGHTYTVLKRVDRIIDDANGRMRTMKSPCLILEGVCYSGEFLAFNAQNDYLFWREVWLESADQSAAAADSQNLLH